jgi:hypothetical protein
MLMVVVGAGASYDSVHPNDHGPGSDASKYRPPLAKQLFDPRASFLAAVSTYPACRPLIGSLRDRVGAGRDVEALLEELVLRAQQGDRQLPRQLMGVRFYLRQIIEDCGRMWFDGAAGVTNHHLLLNSIERWRAANAERVILVTFNYDLMLEDAFSDTLGISFRELDDYIAREDYQLFKLHGSVNWGREVGHLSEFDGGVGAVIDRAADVVESDVFRINSGSFVFEEAQLVPALAVPTETKSTFQCPTEHVAAIEAALPMIDRVLVVGWRGGEHDFLRMWRDRVDPDVEGLVVSGDQAGAEDSARRMLDDVTGYLLPSAAQGLSHLARDEDILLPVLERRLRG